MFVQPGLSRFALFSLATLLAAGCARGSGSAAGQPSAEQPENRPQPPEVVVEAGDLFAEARDLAGYCWTPTTPESQGRCVDGGSYPGDQLYWPILPVGSSEFVTVQFEFAPEAVEYCLESAPLGSEEPQCTAAADVEEALVVNTDAFNEGDWDLTVRGTWPEGEVTYAVRLRIA